jgi:DNA-binding transcriptional LysR family regulator
MDRIEELRVFVTVADMRGFAQAGRRLSISPAQVSKLIARLEDRLNSRLFNRTTRDVSLTDEGRALQARARVLVEEYDLLERSAQETAKPRGVLKLSAPISFGQQLTPTLLDFANLYPDVALDVSFTDRIMNLVEEGFDAAVRISSLADSSLIARKLVDIQGATVAAPQYLAKRGAPRVPDDLRNHEAILDLNTADPYTWVFGAGSKRLEVRVSGRLRFGNPYINLAAARAGFGITRVPDFVAENNLKNGELVSLLEKYEPKAPVTMYIVYPHARHLASKVRVFVDFLIERYTRTKKKNG